MKKSPGKIFFLVIFLSLSSQVLYACGMCAKAQFWKLFPPILIWVYIGYAWYFSYVIIFNVCKQKHRYIPGVILGLILLMTGWVAENSTLGPVAPLPFLVISMVIWVSSFMASSKKYPKRLLNIARILGLLAICGILYTSIKEIVKPTPRGPREMIFKWHGTVLERRAFAELKKKEPESISVYREVIREGVSQSALDASERLAEIGNPEIDVPLMIDAMEKARMKKDEYIAERIEELLQKASNLSLPKGTSSKKWKEEWEKRSKNNN